jgi:hypothetical protein
MIPFTPPTTANRIISQELGEVWNGKATRSKRLTA